MKSIKITLAASAAVVALCGCSTVFTGTHQDIQVRTHHEEVGGKLDNVARFTVIGDAYRVKFEDIGAAEQVALHRKNAPIVVKVRESDCILPSEEHFDAGIHPAVLLDVLATSPLSTSIDSSTGAAWRYDKTLYVTPKIKDTPACRRWLEEEIKRLPEDVQTKLIDNDSQVNLGGYGYDPNAVRHPIGYEDQFKKPDSEQVKQTAQ